MLKQLSERRPEHPIHATIQDEVDGTVEQSEYVHDLPKTLIALQKKAPPHHSDTQRKNPLRKFGYQKQQQHRHQHLRGPIRSPFRLVRLLSVHIIQIDNGRTDIVTFQYVLALLRLEQGADQPATDHCEDAAG